MKGFPSINHPNQVCEVYISGKQHRDFFPSEKSMRGIEPLKLIHTDYARWDTHPMEEASILLHSLMIIVESFECTFFKKIRRF